LDEIASCIEEVREKFHKAVGFDEMLHRLRYDRPHPITDAMEMMMERRFRHDLPFGGWMDGKRSEAIELLNSILAEVGHPPFTGLTKLLERTRARHGSCQSLLGTHRPQRLTEPCG